jgi:hypothetical protein
LAALVLVGCAAPEIPFEHGTTPVKTIAIVSPSVPSGPSVVLASTVGQSFGLVGALIDAGMQANRDSQFKALLDRPNFSVQERFTRGVAEALASAGYTVVMVPLQRDRAEFAATYPATSDGPVDAYLDLVVTNYGYVAAGIGSSTPYRPLFAVRARLVSARDRSVLMQDQVIYNPIGVPPKTVTIAPDPTYQFANFDALIANGPHAVTGLHTAVAQSSEAIGKLLR